MDKETPELKSETRNCWMEREGCGDNGSLKTQQLLVLLFDLEKFDTS